MIRRERVLLAVAILAIALFLSLALAVRAELLAPLDTAILHAVHALDTPALVGVMTAITTLGWAPLVILMVAGVAGWAWLRRDRTAALALVLIGLADLAADNVLKLTFRRVRPALWPHIELATFSFPSGHAMTSVAVYGMTAAVVARLYPPAERPAWIAAPLIALAVGSSRVFLGVHWPSDVLAGWSIGIVLLIIGGIALLRRPHAAPDGAVRKQ